MSDIRYVTVSSSQVQDTDSDTVPDSSDQCPNTATTDHPVVTSSPTTYLGCSCNQIYAKVPNPTDDGKPCTDDICSISSSGIFGVLNPPKTDGSQPAGYTDACLGTSYVDYYCLSGVVTNTTTANANACVTCSNQCTSGTSQCNSAGIPQLCQTISGCTQWVSQNACTTGYVCSGGSCVNSCTNQCTSGTTQCSSTGVPQVCQLIGTCTSWVNQTACITPQICVAGNCTAYSLGLYTNADHTTHYPTSLEADDGTSLLIYPFLSPTASASYEMGGSTITSGAFTLPISGARGTTITQSFIGKISGTQVASNTLTIHITCEPGDACYCQSDATSGCVISGATSASKAGQCILGTCAYCAAGLFYDATTQSCVQCITNSTCTNSVNPTCQYRTCTNNICGVGNAPNGLACGNSLVCSNGYCAGCAANSDCPSSTILRNETTVTGDGCTNQTVTKQDLTAGICQINADPTKNKCSFGTTTTTIVQTYTSPMPNNATCPTGVCWQGSCVPQVCANSNPGAVINWEGNFSICNGQVEFCSQTYNRTDFYDHTCTNSSTPGLCRGQDYCLQKCEVLINNNTNMPGCVAQGLSNAYDNGRACPSNLRCFACNAGFYYYNGACVETNDDYTFDFAASGSAAQGDITITPLLSYRSTAVTNDDHRYLFRLTANEVTKESFGPITIRFTDPGDRSVSIVALHASGALSGQPIATVTKTLTVTCPLNNACCPASSNAYLPDGASCSSNSIPGTCQNKICVLGCVPTGQEVCNNGKDDDCNGRIDCSDSACASFCGGLQCEPSERICDRACVDIQTSSSNCGACGNRCGTTQQCIQGSCTEVEGCDVICNTDAECGRGMICINPGSCDKSYCAPANVIVANESDAANIMSQYNKTFKVDKEIRGNEIILTITNLAPVRLQNFTLIANIPKDIASSAQELGADQEFQVINNDPIISFNFPEVSAKQVITIELSKDVDPAYANSIQISGSHNPITESPDLLTNEVTITSNLVKENGKTKLLLGINPHAELYGVRVPVQIPKCIAQSAAALKLSGDYEIIQDDPLVVWTFDALTSKETLEIEVNGDVSENCKNQLTAFAVADTVDKPINPWIPLLLIPVVGFIIVFFQRFHGDGAQERLSRKEFERLAREQGAKPEEIEAQWREYDRKF